MRLRERLVDELRRHATGWSAELAAAFAAVPRELFLADGFRRPGGGWARPGDPDFLELVYTDDALVTKVRGAVPVSSSSQPSLMATMLAALDVRPGARVLEVGAGSGYNAALLTRLGATVTSVDVQPDVAARARAALHRAGVSGVEVVTGDGWAGRPGATFDRVIVTVGVAGVSPRWLEQLTPGGFVLAPVEHAGIQPALRVQGAPGGPVTARPVCPCGFMTAAGPLHPALPGAHPAPAGALAGLEQVAPPCWDPPPDPAAYRDLWYAAGVWHRRASHAALPGHGTCVALLDGPRTGGAVLPPDGSVLAAGPQADRYAADAVALRDRWQAAGRPALTSWRVDCAEAGDPDAPIWVPHAWHPA